MGAAIGASNNVIKDIALSFPWAKNFMLHCIYPEKILINAFISKS